MTSGGSVDPEQDELAAALRDSIRRRLLFVLGDRPEGATIRQLAQRLGESPRRTRHYVEMLVAAGLVVIGEERTRRGTIERVFRSARQPMPMLWVDEWPGKFGVSESKMFLLDILRLTFDSVTEAIAEGTFVERPGWCAARTWREVDAEGWDELVEIHERALQEVMTAIGRAAERLAKGEEEPIPAISALLLFEALPWG